MSAGPARTRPLRPSRRCAAGAVAFALALLAAPAGATTRVDAALASARSLAAATRFAAADSAARAVLDGAAGAPAPLDSAAAIAVLVGARYDLQRLTAPGTRALAERAVAIREARAPRDTLALAAALDQLGNVRFAAGENAAAKALFERALALRSAVLPAGDPLLAFGAHNLARVAYATGDYAGARDGFERARAMRERALGHDHREVARSLAGLSTALSVLGELTEASAAAESALAIRERVLPRDHPDVLISMGYAERLRAQTGDLLGARALGERAVAAADRAYGPDSPLAAQPRIELGNVLDQLGDDAGARACFERALAIDERVYGPRHRVVVQAIDWLAQSLISHGDVDAAEPLVARGLALLDSIPEPSAVDRSVLLTSRARALAVRQRFAEAESATVEVLRLDERTYGADHPNVGHDCNSIGAYRCDLGDYAGGRPWFERAVALYERAGRSDSLHLAISLDGLGATQMAAGDSADAVRTLDRALAIRTRWQGPDHPDLAPALNHLAMLAARGGHAADELALALRAEDLSRRQLANTVVASSEREALALEAARLGGLDLAVDAATRDALAADGRRAAWDAAIRSRALVLDAMALRTHAAVDGDGALAARRATVIDARRNLAALVVRGPGRDAPARYPAMLDHWRHEVDLAERALLAASPALARHAARDSIGYAAVAAALPPGSALLAYVRYRPPAPGREFDAPRYAAFVLRAGAGAPRCVPLGAASDLEAALERWSAALGRRPSAAHAGAAADERAARDAGEAVRRRIWDPLATALAGARRVFVVPDGALALVPLAALPAPGGRYLVESGPLVHVLTSERDLVDDGATRAPGNGLLALGGAAFDTLGAESTPLLAAAAPERGLRARCAEFSRVRFAPLPGTLREAEDVAAEWRAAAPDADEATVLSGARADPTDFERLAPGHRVLHLATHGFFVDPRCATGRGGRGVGELADAGPAPAPVPEVAPTESPLRLSGLALAGANRREQVPPGADDGILTAEEVAALDLDGVEWAVLSGCDTGVGRLLAGEGVLGLRRAFLTAGARTVIMSLWPVEDAATRDWMVALYRHRLIERLDTAESVRAAARDLIAARRARGLDTHPFRWAAFLAAGDWR